MKNAWAGGGDFPVQQSYIQTAYENTTDKWQDLVQWLGDSIGYEWILIAALVGMPFTVLAILRKLGFIKKHG